MLQQRTAGLGQRHALTAARQKRYAEDSLHVADAGRRRGKRQMCAFGTVGNAAGFNHMAKQAEINEVKAHRRTLPSSLTKSGLIYCSLYIDFSRLSFRVIRNLPDPNIWRFALCCIAAGSRIG